MFLWMDGPEHRLYILQKESEGGDGVTPMDETKVTFFGLSDDKALDKMELFAVLFSLF